MFAENLAQFFDTEAHGVNMTVGASTVPGIFNNGYGEALGASGAEPTFTCEAAVLAAASGTVGAAVSVNGTNYTIAELQPDGTGVVVVILERA